MADDATGTPDGLTEHAARNRAMWDGYSDEYQSRHGLSYEKCRDVIEICQRKRHCAS